MIREQINETVYQWQVADSSLWVFKSGNELTQNNLTQEWYLKENPEEGGKDNYSLLTEVEIHPK